jgi:hypothetical protein
MTAEKCGSQFISDYTNRKILGINENKICLLLATNSGDDFITGLFFLGNLSRANKISLWADVAWIDRHEKLI